jgi:SpoVK/Ycf46/Vps4 family AAA+-type ATPase
MKRPAVVLALALLVACKKERIAAPVADGIPATETAAIAQMARSAPAAMPVPPGPATPQAAAIPRMIVRTAEVSLVVGDTASSVDTLTALAAANGGYITASRLWRDGQLLRATLTIRVPAPHLDAMLAAIRKAARRVESETVGGDDVTQEYVDLESQLRNLEAAEVEMRALMTTVRERTKKAQDILDVYQQLTQLRGEIEKAKGRMRYLSQMSAMSTITLTLVPDAIAKPVVEPGWQPAVVMKDASRALVKTLQGASDAAIWVVIYFGPLLLIVAGALFVVWRVVRRRGRGALTEAS